MRYLTHASIAAGLMALAGSAQAGYVGGPIDLQIDYNGQSWLMSQYPDQFTVTTNADGSMTIVGHGDVSSEFGVNYRLDVGGPNTGDRGAGDGVASVTSNFTLTNTAAITNTFTVTAIVPITVPFAATGMRGSFSGSVLDNSASFNGATIATAANTPMYSALIDGVVVRTLRNDPFATSALGGQTASIPTTNFGVPAFQPGPAAVSTIAITNVFTLTADDSATNSSSFIITVPAPGAAALTGLAGLVGLRRRR